MTITGDVALELPLAPGEGAAEDSAAAGSYPPSGRPLLELNVYGRPAPQGSKRIVPSGRPGGRVHVIESSAAVKPWREAVRTSVRVWIGEQPSWTPLDGPLHAAVVFTLPKPKSAPKTRRTYPDRIPDLSKLLRSTEDALVDAGAIADDARVVEYSRLAKVFPGEDVDALEVPGAVIRIWPVTR